MRRSALLPLLPVLLAFGGAARAEPVPTVIVDIGGIGPQRLAALKQDSSVRWSAEFGQELLLGVAASALPGWLARERVRPGIGKAQADELWVRGHACVHQSLQPALAGVGGFEILRMPAPMVRQAKRAGLAGLPLPADGVVSHEWRNRDGAPKAAPQADPAVQAVVNRIDAERWFQTMSLLAGFNRNSYSLQLGSSRDWILSAFEDAGLTTSTFGYTLSGANGCTPTPPAVNIDNPIGRKTGVEFPDEWIVVGAHYDSRNSARCDGVANPQPGANDNASGCAGVIEMARAFAGVPTSRSILFTCFSGEEQGLWGSRRYVESLQASGDIAKVRHMVNLDMIGHDVGATLDAQVVTSSAQASWAARYATAAATYAPELNIINSTSVAANTDYWYFLQAGVPAVFTWENGVSDYPQYHTVNDLPANMNRAREVAGGILKMDTAVLSDVAGLLPMFANGFE